MVYAGRYGDTGPARRHRVRGQQRRTRNVVKVTSVHDYTDPSQPDVQGRRDRHARHPARVRQPEHPASGRRRSRLRQGDERHVHRRRQDRHLADGRSSADSVSSTRTRSCSAATAPTRSRPASATRGSTAAQGNDVIVTGDRTVLNAGPEHHAYSYVNPDAKAIVAGGAGDDSITVGNGDDIVAGDSSLGAPPTTGLNLTDLKNDGRDTRRPVGVGSGSGRRERHRPRLDRAAEPRRRHRLGRRQRHDQARARSARPRSATAATTTSASRPTTRCSPRDPSQAALFHSARRDARRR